MKRFLSVLLVAVLTVTCFATVVFAAGSTTLSVSEKEVAAGETVIIGFSISEAEIANYGMWITYDSSVLTLKSIDKGSATKGSFVSNVSGNFACGADTLNSTVSGNLFTATFEVSDSAKPGTYPISVNLDYIADEKNEDLNVTIDAGWVKIPEPETDPTKPSETEPHETEKDDPTKDDEPKTGDIPVQYYVIPVLVLAAALLMVVNTLKRKFAK